MVVSGCHDSPEGGWVGRAGNCCGTCAPHAQQVKRPTVEIGRYSYAFAMTMILRVTPAFLDILDLDLDCFSAVVTSHVQLLLQTQD